MLIEIQEPRRVGYFSFVPHDWRLSGAIDTHEKHYLRYTDGIANENFFQTNITLNATRMAQASTRAARLWRVCRLQQQRAERSYAK